MVNLMDKTRSGGQNQVQHPKLRNRQLLDIFTHLADGKEDRQKCTSQLVSYLSDKEEEARNLSLDDDTKYSIRRLIQGLSSDRLVARLGYSVALCQLLRENKTVTNEILFQFIEESAKAHGTQGNNKKSIRNARIGKVFAYLVLVQSQKLFSAESEQITNVVGDLIKMSAEKDYLAHLCAVAISQIIAKVKRKVFQKYVWPDIEDKLKFGWAGCSPDDLLIVINIKRHHSKVCSDFLTDKWDGSHVITEKTFHYLSEIFKRTSKLYPVVHSVIDAAISEVIERELEIAEFWKKAVSPVFERTRSSTHSIGLYIFDKLIPHIKKLSPSLVEEILYPSITTEMAHHNKEAVAKVMTLVKDTSDGKIQLTVLKCFVLQTDEPHHDIINNIVNSFVPEAIVLLKKELIKCYNMKTSWISGKENKVAWYKWCVIVLDSMVTKVDELPWQMDILQFLFIHSFFIVQKSSDLPHCKALADQHEDSVRASTSQHFFKALTRLMSYNQKNISRSSQFNNHLDVLYQIAQYADTLLQNPDNLQLHSQSFSNEARQQWSKMMELLPALQKKRRTSEKLGLHHAFELLFIYTGLQLFSDSTAEEVLQELHVCYKKTSQRRKSKVIDGLITEELAWIEVVTELLLSFMLKGSNLSRNIAKTAMETLADHVTPESLQLILDALQSSADDEEGMVGVKEEEEDSDSDKEMDTDKTDDDSNTNNGKNMGNSDESDDDDGDEDDDEKDEGDNNLVEAVSISKTKKTVMMNGKGVNGDDDDDDSEVEEEDGIEVGDDVKKKIKEALGEAAVDSDESSDDEDLSDTEMFQYDEKLAEAFKSMSRSNSKKADKEKREQLVLFKVRTCDLLDVIVRKNPSVQLIKEMVLPILDRVLAAQRWEKEHVLFNRARQILDLMCKTKKMIVDTKVDKDELLETFKELMKLSTRKVPKEMMEDVTKACALVVRMILTIEGHTAPSPVKTRSKRKKETQTKKDSEDYHDKVVSLVQSGLQEAFKNKSGHSTVYFYGYMLERNNQLFWPVWEGLLEIISSTDLKTYVKADAVIVLRRLLHKDLARQLDSEEWSLFVVEVRKMAENVLQTVTSKEKHFTRELLNLFVKVYHVSTDQNFKLLEDREMKILEDMMSDFNLEIVRLFRKVYRFIYKKELPNKKQKRKNETSDGEKSSPSKKAKLDHQSVGNGDLAGLDESVTHEKSESLKMNGKKQKKRKHSQKTSIGFDDLETSLASPTEKAQNLTPSLVQQDKSPKAVLKQEIESSKTSEKQKFESPKTSLKQDENCPTSQFIREIGSNALRTPVSQKKKSKKKQK